MGQRVVSPILRRTTITATTSCRTEFFDMARAERAGEIPADAHENDRWGKCAPLKLIAIVSLPHASPLFMERDPISNGPTCKFATEPLAEHTSLSMTQRYIEGDSEDKRKLVNLI